jgi:uncharacterized SAM-binding protein YcdF (DUF218 family)
MSDIFWVLKKVIGYFSDPVTLVTFTSFVVFVVFFIMGKRVSKRAVLLSYFTLWIIGTPLAGHLLLEPIESKANDNLFSFRQHSADAIVVMGCGHVESNILPLSSRYQTCSMRRVVHSVIIQKRSGLPVYFSGGILPNRNISEGTNNVRLARNLGMKSDKAHSFGNATDSASEAQGFKGKFKGKNIVLITSASHMYRAKKYFEDQGIGIYSSPTDHLVIYNVSAGNVRSYLPSWSGYQKSARAIYEYLALISQALFNR